MKNLKTEIGEIILKYYNQERINKLKLDTEINHLVLTNLNVTNELLNLFKNNVERIKVKAFIDIINFIEKLSSFNPEGNKG